MNVLGRRHVLGAAIGAGTGLMLPRFAFARADTERRFVFVMQRGGADGLNTVIPIADPAYAALRGTLAIPAADTLPLNGTFGLHPALAEIGRCYAAGQAIFFHAVASAYRERSHFDAQNVLETGGSQPYELKDGWLNRLVKILPGGKAVSVAHSIPAALRGTGTVLSVAPARIDPASDDLLQRVGGLYADDTQLKVLWNAALQAKGMGAGPASPAKGDGGLGSLVGRLLAQPDGPRIAMIESNGWDTHRGQAAGLMARLKELDATIGGLRAALGRVWSDTVVIVATEFGRTAAVNGTGGTDHGTGAAAMLLGGAVQGGRVIADWPGLSGPKLYDRRDLRPTLGIDQVIAGAAAGCFAIGPDEAIAALYPIVRTGKPLEGLIKNKV